MSTNACGRVVVCSAGVVLVVFGARSAPGGPPANDNCSDAPTIVEGALAFSNLGATDDGPPLPKTCEEGFGLAFGSDIWYVYEPACNGTLTVSTCAGTGYDSRLASYTGDCGDLTFVGCNDDGPGCPNFSSLMEVPVTLGTPVIIRVGGYDGAQGSGTLVLACASVEVDCAPGDVNHDGVVNVDDLVAVILGWGACPQPCPPCAADVNGDCDVDVDDLVAVVLEWGAVDLGGCIQVEDVEPAGGGPGTEITLQGNFPLPDRADYCLIASDPAGAVVVPFEVTAVSSSSLTAVVGTVPPGAGELELMIGLGAGNFQLPAPPNGARLLEVPWSWEAFGPGFMTGLPFTPIAEEAGPIGGTFFGALSGGDLTVTITGGCPAGTELRIWPRAHHDADPAIPGDVYVGYDAFIPSLCVTGALTEAMCAELICDVVTAVYAVHTPLPIPVSCTTGPDPAGGTRLTLSLIGLDIDFGTFDIEVLPTADSDADGVPDCIDCEEPLDIVLIADTSGSVFPDVGAICTLIADLAADLTAEGFTVTSDALGITESVGAAGFTCLSGNVLSLYGPAIPGGGTLGDCDPANAQAPQEDWGAAVAIVAERRPWTGPNRAIVVVADEGPRCGDPCEDPGPDRAIIDGTAIPTAAANGVPVFTILLPMADACATGLADDLASGTLGATYSTAGMSYPAIRAALVTALNSTVCCPWDLNYDGVVDVTDILIATLNAGCMGPACLGDVNDDGVVDTADLDEIAMHLGPCPA